VCSLLGFVALTVKKPFPLDYTQTLLSLLDILSAFYAKLAKLLGPSPFPHASQHMLGLSPHPGVSYLFQNQTHVTPADEALWNVAIGSTTFGSTAAGGGVLSSPPPSWTPALGELVLKVDSKFKVRKWILKYNWSWRNCHVCIENYLGAA
jgi:hypothetical protein